MLKTAGDLHYPKLPTYSISYHSYLTKKFHSEVKQTNKQTKPPQTQTTFLERLKKTQSLKAGFRWHFPD